MRKLLLLAVFGALMMAASLCRADIPRLISYQGMLTDDTGNPLNGNYNLTFKIYSQSSGGAALWTESQNGLSVENGLFNVILGNDTPIPSSVFTNTLRYLGITVGSDSELSPRIRLTSVGYAYRAAVADSALTSPPHSTGGGWTDDGSVIRLNTSTDNVGIGTTSPASKLHVNGAITVNQHSLGSCLIMADNSAVVRWQQYVNPSDQSLRFWQGGSSGADKIIITQPGNVGIGTTSPASKLHVNGAITVNQNPLGSCLIMADDNAIVRWQQYVHPSDQSLRFWQGGGGGDRVTITQLGNVGIGTTNPAYKLHVNGDINVSGNIRKGGTAYTHPDYVFETDYELMSLEDLKEYVSEKKCLPNVISAEEVRKNNGYNMDELLIQMLEKIEEQTLYIFQLEERIAELEKQQR